MKKATSLLIVVSPGGHLLKMTRLRQWWGTFDRLWVTDIKKTNSLLVGEKIVPGFFPENRKLINGFKNFWLAVRLILKKKPSVLISTGAGVALPFFVVGKLMGVRLIFIETFMFIPKPTLTGRILYLFVDEFIVQHREMLRYYPKAKLAEVSL